MAYEFTICGETPSKKNGLSFSRKGGVYKNKTYQKMKPLILLQLRHQWAEIKARTVDYPVEIFFSFTHKDNVRRDSDNQASTLLDIMQEAGILRNDCWQIVRDVHIHSDPPSKSKCAFCTIRIEPWREQDASDNKTAD